MRMLDVEALNLVSQDGPLVDVRDTTTPELFSYHAPILSCRRKIHIYSSGPELPGISCIERGGIGSGMKDSDAHGDDQRYCFEDTKEGTHHADVIPV